MINIWMTFIHLFKTFSQKEHDKENLDNKRLRYYMEINRLVSGSQLLVQIANNSYDIDTKIEFPTHHTTIRNQTDQSLPLATQQIFGV